MHLDTGGDVNFPVWTKPVSHVGDLNAPPTLWVVVHKSFTNTSNDSTGEHFGVIGIYAEGVYATMEDVVSWVA
jgi:hypothetical protein